MTVRHARALPLLSALTVAVALSACAASGPVRSTGQERSVAPSGTSSARGPSTTTTTATTTTATTGTTTRPPSRTTRATTTPPRPSPSASPRTGATPPAGTLPPVPLAGAEPSVRFPRNEPAVGAGANPVVSAVPDALWSRMVGYSWTPGCPVGRSQLRLVSVNFWGFDGHRSRGGVVVSSTIAAATAQAFSRLYGQQFRIRQMRPMDSTWGRNPRGPGADDYAAMSADNTSAFNCRYVGGQEASRVYSKHAYGTAVDVNDFENPYVADDGTVYPQRYFLVRRGPAPGVFSSSSSSAVRAFTAQGMHWGGLWSKPDYQHFER